MYSRKNIYRSKLQRSRLKNLNKISGKSFLLKGGADAEKAVADAAAKAAEVKEKAAAEKAAAAAKAAADAAAKAEKEVADAAAEAEAKITTLTEEKKKLILLLESINGSMGSLKDVGINVRKASDSIIDILGNYAVLGIPSGAELQKGNIKKVNTDKPEATEAAEKKKKFDTRQYIKSQANPEYMKKQYNAETAATAAAEAAKVSKHRNNIRESIGNRPTNMNPNDYKTYINTGTINYDSDEKPDYGTIRNYQFSTLFYQILDKLSTSEPLDDTVKNIIKIQLDAMVASINLIPNKLKFNGVKLTFLGLVPKLRNIAKQKLKKVMNAVLEDNTDVVTEFMTCFDLTRKQTERYDIYDKLIQAIIDKIPDKEQIKKQIKKADTDPTKAEIINAAKEELIKAATEALNAVKN